MARSRLMRAVALLAAVILFCVGFLMLKHHVLDAEGMVLRSLSIALLGGAIASLSGGLAALAAKCSGRPFWLVAASFPLLAPPETIGLALTCWPIGMEPYSWQVIVLGHGISQAPIAALFTAVIFSRVDRAQIQMAAISASSNRVFWRILFPLWVQGGATSTLICAMLALADPSLTLVFGSTESYLASHALRSAIAGLGGNLAVAFLMISLAIALTILVLHQLGISGLAPAVEQDAPRRQPATALADSLPANDDLTIRSFPFFLSLAGKASAVLLASAVVICLINGLTRFEVVRGDFLMGLLVIFLAVVASAAVSLLIVAFVQSRTVIKLCAGASICLLCVCQTLGGLYLSENHREPIRMFGRTVFPSLVGSGSPGGGVLGIGLAYASIALPLSLLSATYLFAQAGRIRMAASASGAGVLRSAATVVRELAGGFFAVVLLIAQLLLTRSAPAIFVGTVDVSFIHSNLLSAIESRDLQAAFSTSLVVTAVAAGVLVCSVTLWQAGKTAWGSLTRRVRTR